MNGAIGFDGLLTGNITEGGGSGVTPHVTATASVNDQTGVPGVTVVRTGPDAAPNFDFNFVNLRGQTELQELRDRRDSQEQQDRQELRDHEALQEQQEQQAPQAPTATARR